MKKQDTIIINRLGEIAGRLSAISLSDALALELKAIIEEMVEVELMGIYFYNDKRKKLELKVTKGFTFEERLEAERTAEERHPGWVFRNKKHLLDQDTQKSEISVDSKRSFKVQSRLYLPIMSQNDCVGACGLASTKAHFFNDEHIAVLRFISGVAGVVYTNLLLKENLEMALKEANAAKNAKQAFLAKMSHEIRTPMNAIIGMTSLLKKTPLNREQREYIDAVSVSNELLLDIVNDILDISKIESEQFKIEKIPFSIAHITQSVYNTFKYKANSKGIDLKLSIDQRLTVFSHKGDPLRLKQVLINLVNNAIKFTDHGSVTLTVNLVEVEEHIHQLLFRVMDTGVGIAEESQSKIFETFTQENSSVTRLYGGSGLGLSIAREIVMLHGGKIQVDSQVGKGSSFLVELELPVAKRVEESEHDDTEEKEYDLNGVKVLLVEDNPINQFYARAILKKKSCDIMSADNGKIAVDMVDKHQFDVILMDMQMPEMDGITAAGIIKNEKEIDVPIIALTANTQESDEKRCLDAGMVAFIQKPFLPKQLVSLLGKLLNRKEVEAEKELELEIAESDLFDIKSLLSLTQNDVTFVNTIMQMFILQVPPAIDSLNEAFDKKDIKKVLSICHKLKSSYQHLHVNEGYILLAKIEEGVETYGLQSATVQAFLSKLEKVSSLAVAQMQAYLKDGKM